VSAANLDLMRRLFDTLAKKGVEATLPVVSEQFEMRTPSEFAAEPDTYRGHDGIRRWWNSFYEAMDEVRLEPGEMRSLGDQVAIRSRLMARGRTTGLEFTQEVVLLATVEEEKLTRLELYGSFEEAGAATA